MKRLRGASATSGWLAGMRSRGTNGRIPVASVRGPVHRQLDGSDLAGQLGPSQLDAAQRGGVDDDLEGDAETGMLEAD